MPKLKAFIQQFNWKIVLIIPHIYFFDLVGDFHRTMQRWIGGYLIPWHRYPHQSKCV